MRTDFSKWFTEQHGERTAGGKADLTDVQLLDRIQVGLEAQRLLTARQLWDEKETSALYAWQAAQNTQHTSVKGSPAKADVYKVGFWYSASEKHLPKPEAHVRPWKNQALFSSLLRRIQNDKAEVKTYRGFSLCRLCNGPAGNSEFSYRNFSWPEGLLHYVDDHNVTLPEDFVTFILNTGKKKP